MVTVSPGPEAPEVGTVLSAGLPSHGGSDVLVMRASHSSMATVGRRALAQEWYCGVGSGGLAARCGRHPKAREPQRWHIDYILPHLTVSRIWYRCGAGSIEHDRTGVPGAWPPSAEAWPRFGASACRCASHLWFFGRRPSPKAFARVVGEPGIRGWAPEGGSV